MKPRCAVLEYEVAVGVKGRALDLSGFESGNDFA
jgi:hypothetical protein